MKKSSGYPNMHMALLLAFFCLWAGACGRKMPPVPPGVPALPPVADLKHHVDGDMVTLSWAAPKGKGSETLAGYAVMRSVTDLNDDDCAGCPILFERVTTLGPSSTDYRDHVAQGKRYIYKVMAYTSYKAWSPDSKLIRFMVPLTGGKDS